MWQRAFGGWGHRAGDRARVRAIAFRAVENPLGDALLHRSDRPLHVAGNLALDEYRGGRNVQMIIEDAAEVPD